MGVKIVPMATLRVFAEQMARNIEAEQKIMDDRITVVAKARMAGMNWIQVAECLNMPRSAAIRMYEHRTDKRMVELLEKL